MSALRQFPAQVERVETGPVQFGDDWPGVFIRGDNALTFAISVRNVLDRHDVDGYTRAILRGLISDLESCRAP